MAMTRGIYATVSPIKNVLFLAPGQGYAKTVATNLTKDLEKARLGWGMSEGYEAIYVRTDNVSLQIVYTDPVKWTGYLFENRDAVFGKKELVEKAKEYCMHRFLDTPCMSLRKYIIGCTEQSNPSPEKPRTSYIPEIAKVHFNDPVTVVLWEDGTKTMVRCQEDDEYSKETGLALCIAKKALGNMPNFNNVFRKWIPEDEEAVNVNTVNIDRAGVAKLAQDIVDTLNKKCRRWRFPNGEV